MNDAKIVLGLMVIYGLMFIGWWIGKTTSDEDDKSNKAEITRIITLIGSILLFLTWANSLFNLIYHNINTTP